MTKSVSTVHIRNTLQTFIQLRHFISIFYQYSIFSSKMKMEDILRNIARETSTAKLLPIKNACTDALSKCAATAGHRFRTLHGDVIINIEITLLCECCLYIQCIYIYFQLYLRMMLL